MKKIVCQFSFLILLLTLLSNMICHAQKITHADTIITESFHANGKKLSEEKSWGNYKEKTQWDSLGILTMKGVHIHNASKQKTKAEIFEYYPDGKLKSSSRLRIPDHTSIMYMWIKQIEWNENGTLKKKHFIKPGKKAKLKLEKIITYDENGKKTKKKSKGRFFI